MVKLLMRLGCLSLMLLLAACGGNGGVRETTPVAYDGATCTAGPKSRYGNPETYRVLGKTYRVLPSACGYVGEGIASWYGPNFHGKRTSSGETYDMNALSAAHKTLPIPVMVKVTNLENGRSMVLRVNDRGPFHEGRIIDLSKGAAEKLGVIAQGTARVKVEAIGKPSDSAAASGSDIKDYRNRLYVQVGSFSDQTNAKQTLNRLLNEGFADVGMQQIQVSGRTVHRVRVGPYTSPDAAERQHDKLSRLGYRGHRVLTE